MDIEEVKEYCRSFSGAVEELTGDPSNILTYKIAGKKFAYFKTSHPEKWRFSIRASPEVYIELTDQDGIKPARYMHRFHWITIVQVNSIPADHLKAWIQWSYRKAVSGLPKKTQTAINA